MENKFNTMTLYSPVPERNYIWVGEYRDGTLLSEFEGKKANSFYDIKKEDLKRFGLFGEGKRYYYNISTGRMYLAGREVSFKYKVKDKIYNLTDNKEEYNDIIQFKRSAADFNPFGGGSGNAESTVIGYCFGYKSKVKHEDIEFNFKPIFKIEENLPKFINVNLVSNKALDGELVITIGGEERIYKAPLKKGVAGQLNYVIKDD